MENTRFNVKYGNGLIHTLENSLPNKRLLIVTQENIWARYGDLFSHAHDLFFVESMDEQALLGEYERLPTHEAVIGLGGGVAVDCAKFFAWKGGAPVYFVPTAVSVDACFSYPVAVRRNNNVVYVGDKLPQTIFVDFEIIQSAPRELNRFGLGDVLSCYTALFDWRLMCEAQISTMDEGVYAKTQNLIDLLFDNAQSISDVTPAGIRLLLSGYQWVGEQSKAIGHCHFEEGSEHYFAYAVESVSGLHLAHGQLVCLGIYVLSKLQHEGRQFKVGQLLRRVGINFRPEDVGFDREVFNKALLMLNSYVLEQKLAYSILNEKQITQEFIDEVLLEIDSLHK